MDEKRSGRIAFFQWAAVLALAMPMTALWFLILAVQRQRSGTFEVLGSLPYSEKEVFLYQGFEENMRIWALVGGAVAILALLGFVVVLMAWRIKRRVEKTTVLPLLTMSGLTLAMMLLGLSLLLGNLVLEHNRLNLGWFDWAGRVALVRAEFAPSLGPAPFLMATLSLIAVTGLFVVIRLVRGKDAGVQPGGWAVAASVVVFLLGLSFFASTRGHATDAASLPRLLKVLHGEDDGDILFVQKNIVLPDLKNTHKLDQAPVIIVGDGLVDCEGKIVGRLDDLVTSENLLLPDLLEILSNLKRQFEQLHPNQDFSGRIILQCDMEAPGPVVAKVLLSCARSGYRNVQIATSGIIKYETAVAGSIVRYRPRGFPFELIDAPAEGAMDLPGDETLGAWAKKLDAVAGRGGLLVRLTSVKASEMD